MVYSLKYLSSFCLSAARPITVSRLSLWKSALRCCCSEDSMSWISIGNIVQLFLFSARPEIVSNTPGRPRWSWFTVPICSCIHVYRREWRTVSLDVLLIRLGAGLGFSCISPLSRSMNRRVFKTCHVLFPLLCHLIAYCHVATSGRSGASCWNAGRSACSLLLVALVISPVF